MLTYATPIFITELFHLVTYVQHYLNDFYSKVMAYIVLNAHIVIRLVSMVCFNEKATPINDTDHNFHIKAVEFA